MTMRRARRTISAAEFKARCLALLDEVCATKETVVVTKRGKPVARVVAVEEPVRPRTLRGSVRYLGNIVAPIDEAWEALR